MLPPDRSLHQIAENQNFDDLKEEFPPDTGFSRQRTQEKTRVLINNLIDRWYWMVLGLIVGTLISAYYASQAPKLYTASTTILIKDRSYSMMARSTVEGLDPGSAEAMNTIIARITRFELLEKVAAREDVRSLQGLVPEPVDLKPPWLSEKLGQTPQLRKAPQPAPSPSILAGMISSWLNITIRQNTRLADISITHPVPIVTKTIADAIAREYITEITNNRNDERRKSIDLLEKQSNQARNDLQSNRASLAIYARAIEVHKSLDARETEVNALRRRYLPKHPKMIAANASLNGLQKQFLREFDDVRQTANEKSYWITANEELQNKNISPDEYLRIARQQLLARIGVLESEIQSSTAIFNSMLTRIEEATLNQDFAESTTNISSLARVPGSPSATSPYKMMTKGGMGGLLAGALIALLLSRLDNKFYTVAQIIDETGVNVLGAIANITPNHLAAAEEEFSKRYPNNKQDYHARWNKCIIFRPGISSTTYSEMYNVLRASISLLGDESKHKITLFTSALPGEGKTLTSCNYALAAATQGHKTLLIDLDLRKPAVHKVFGIDKEQVHSGASEYLNNDARFEEIVIRNTDLPNFHLILSGKTTANPNKLLTTGKLIPLLQEAYRQYDVIVLDSAPLLAVSDTRIIAPLVNHVCLVCRAEYVPKGAVRQTLRTFEESGIAISGIVFNAFAEKRRLMSDNYSYGYYKTSRYGKGYSYGYGAYGGVYGSDETDANWKAKKKSNKK